jgi:hypothetical protein
MDNENSDENNSKPLLLFLTKIKKIKKQKNNI